MNRYWHKTGLHQDKMLKLQDRIPSAGPVPMRTDNPRLDVLRKAINIYSDLYTTTLIHMAQSFSGTFKFRSTDYLVENSSSRSFSPKLYIMVEEAMDDIVMEAWLEQLKAGKIS